MIAVLFLIFPPDGAYRVREQGSDSAISAQETSLPAPSALRAAAKDMTLGRCALLLLHIVPAASTVATAERVRQKTEKTIRDWAGSGPFFHKTKQKRTKNVKDYRN